MKPVDIAVIAAYLAVMAGMGFWFMHRNRNAEIAGIDPFDDCDFCRGIADFDKMS